MTAAQFAEGFAFLFWALVWFGVAAVVVWLLCLVFGADNITAFIDRLERRIFDD